MTALLRLRLSCVRGSERPPCAQEPTYPVQQNVQNLLDHLVGCREKRRRHLKAECLGGLLVDDELEPGRLQYGQVARPFAVEYPTHVNACLAPRLCNARSVAQEKAGGCELAPRRNGRNRKCRCQSRDLLGLFVEKSVGDYDERIRAQLRELLEGRIDLALGAGVEHTDVLAERPRSRLQVRQLALSIGIFRVEQGSDGTGSGHYLMDHLQPLRIKRVRENGVAGQIAARSIQPLD